MKRERERESRELNEGAMKDNTEVVVVDANAIIHHSGGGAEGLANMLPPKLRNKALEGTLKLVTLPQVLEEIRDKKARQVLSESNALLRLETLDPTDDAVKAVTSFSKKTGDIHVLSAVDLKLVALAYDMERQHVSSVDHIRTFPLPSLNVENTSRRNDQVVMPGWDPKDNHDEEWGSGEQAQQQDQGESKIRFSRLDGKQLDDKKNDDDDDHHQHDCDGDGEQEASEDQEQEKEKTAGIGGKEGTKEFEPVIPSDQDAGDGWETARKSKNAQRKHKRKMLRKLEKKQEEQNPPEQTDERERDAEGNANVQRGSSGESPPSVSKSAASNVSGGSEVVVDSPVVSLTGDFAMQNVLLQMGLKVAGPKDGMLIKEARKFGLRCHACGFSTDNPQTLTNDLFCPKCGNMNTLERCQVVVNSDGQVIYLQLNRKSQTLRGTQYSLPAPRTGRNANNPILREDSLKLPKRKPKADLDAFAPEYNEETWHNVHKNDDKSDLAKTMYLEQVRQSAKKNPNVRKLTRTNRRR